MPDGRFAPSPTGSLHLGSLRTALLAWLFARSSGSRFVVRVEDLDSGRVRERFVGEQLADLAALGLDWDGEPLRQSARLDAHAEAIAALEARGILYPCFCTRREIAEAASAPHGPLPEGAYPGTCRELSAAGRAERERQGRPPALRLRADAEAIEFTDRLHGRVTRVVDDLVVRRNDGAPAYNLAVIVDDAWQGIGEVVRGDDLLDSTPRQIRLARELGLPVPAFAHVALVLGPDGMRLAKRDGAITLHELAESPAEVLAWLARTLGLAERGEAVTPGTLLERFDPDRLPRTPTNIKRV